MMCLNSIKLQLSVLGCILFVSIGFTQQVQLSPNADISVLTFGPGKYLNDAFGHNAFRIKDISRGIDVVYGYGRYDFDAPNFYLKFAQGKLNYLISKNTFRDIYQFYSSEDRTIDEQLLNLSQSQKQALYDFLINNYKPQNRRYLYDFFYDNCATRIRDVAQTATNNKIVFSDTTNHEPKTYRTLIHEHVGRNSWGSFGIDLALGSVIDRPTSSIDQMFLPKYIYSSFEHATLSGKPLVIAQKNIYKAKEHLNYKSSILFSPFVILTILALFIIYITYKDKTSQSRSRWLDMLLFGLTSIIGIVLLLLWFATNHTATGYNYNLLWAFPLNLAVIVQLSRPVLKTWVKGYLKFLLIMLMLMTLHWFMGIQVFAIALIPLLLALAYRYIFLIDCINRQ